MTRILDAIASALVLAGLLCWACGVTAAVWLPLFLFSFLVAARMTPGVLLFGILLGINI